MSGDFNSMYDPVLVCEGWVCRQIAVNFSHIHIHCQRSALWYQYVTADNAYSALAANEQTYCVRAYSCQIGQRLHNGHVLQRHGKFGSEPEPSWSPRLHFVQPQVGPRR
jgi:hypothetical protein